MNDSTLQRFSNWVTTPDPWLALGLFLISFLTISSMVPLDLLGGDASELAYGIKQLSPVHPPGYPLYRLLGHGLIEGLGWNYPVGPHKLSVLYGALSLAVFYLFLRRRGIGSLSSIAGITLLTISMPVWPLFVRTEVYTMAMLFFVGTLYLWDFALDHGSGIYLLGFWVGLSLTHHPVAVVNLFFLIHVLFRLGRTVSLKRILLLFCSPVVLYLSLLFPADPFPFQWPELVSIVDVVDHMLGGSFDRFFFARGPWTPIYQLGRLAVSHLAVVPIFAAVFTFVGYGVARGRERLLVGVQLVFLLFLLGYDIPDLSDFLLPSYLLLILFFLRGIEVFRFRWGRGVVLVLVVTCLFSAWGWTRWNGFDYDRSDHQFYGEYVRAVHARAPRGTLVADWGNFTALRYHQLLTDDLDDLSLLTLPATFRLHGLIADHHRNQIPLYLTSKRAWQLPKSAELEAGGINGLYRVVP